MTAVPIEAAICWVMFSSVEPRATSWAFSVCSAEVMIGIIVPPMPRPITNSAPRMQRVRTWSAVELGEHRTCRSVITTMPNEHDLAGPDLVGQDAGDRHGDHRADALRGEQQAGLQRATRRGPAGSSVGTSSRPPKNAIANSEHRDDRDRQVAVLEQPQVEQRVLGRGTRGSTKRDHQQRRRSASGPSTCGAVDGALARGSRRRRRGTARGPGDSSSMPRKSKDSDGSGVSLGSTTPGVDERDDADRHVDQEDPVPAGDVDQPAAEDRAEDRAEQHRDAEDRHQPADPVAGRRPGS